MNTSYYIIGFLLILTLIVIIIYKRSPRIRNYNDMSIYEKELQDKLKKDVDDCPIIPDRERTF